MTDADLREAVARAICRVMSLDPDEVVDNHTPTCPGPTWRLVTDQADAAIALVVARCAEAIEAIHRSDDADPWSDGFGVGLDEALTTTRALAPQEPFHD